MRRLLTTALLASFALPLIATATRAADYDDPYEPEPSRAYERPVEEPPVIEERPIYRPYIRHDVRRFYGRPYHDGDVGHYGWYRHRFGHYGYGPRYGAYGYAPY